MKHALGAALFVTLVAGCGPSLATARTEFEAYNNRAHDDALAGLTKGGTLAPFNPRPRQFFASQEDYDTFLAQNPGYAEAMKVNKNLVIAVGKRVPAKDPHLQGCLYDLSGEIGFVASCGHPPGAQYEFRYFKEGANVVIVRLLSHVVEVRSYDDSSCLRSGLSGGTQMAGPAARPSGPSAGEILMLGVASADAVQMRDVTYPVKATDVTCTGSYETLGYPP